MDHQKIIGQLEADLAAITAESDSFLALDGMLLSIAKEVFSVSLGQARLLAMQLWPQFTMSRGSIAAARLRLDGRTSAYLIAYFAAGIYIRTNSGFFKPKDVKELIQQHQQIERALSDIVNRIPENTAVAFYEAMMDF